MKNSDTFYRIRIVLLAWVQYSILIQLYPSRVFCTPVFRLLSFYRHPNKDIKQPQ